MSYENEMLKNLKVNCFFGQEPVKPIFVCGNISTSVPERTNLYSRINRVKAAQNDTCNIGCCESLLHYTIIDYRYDDEIRFNNDGTTTLYKKTTLTFNDGTRTSVSAPAETADQYTGFYTCYAKHYAGGKNKINDLADYWIKTVPKKIAQKQAKEKAIRDEQVQISESNKKRREKQRTRLEAIRRKEAYDAAILAHEKYGVPMEFNYKNKSE